MAQLEIVGQARIYVEVWVAPHRVVGDNVTVAGVVALRRRQSGRWHRTSRGVRYDIRSRRTAAAQIESIERRGHVIWPRRSRLEDRRKLKSPREFDGAGHGEMMPFVIKRRSEFKLRERLLRITWIVTKRTAVLVITHCTGQCVVHAQIDPVEVALTLAEVHAIVARTPAGCFVADATQHRHARRCAGRVEWEKEAAPSG